MCMCINGEDLHTSRVGLISGIGTLFKLTWDPALEVLNIV